jgi:hypothetical protein
MSDISNNNLYSLVNPFINNSSFLNDSLNEINNIKTQINEYINDNNTKKQILDKVEKDIKILSVLNDSILVKFYNIKK